MADEAKPTWVKKALSLTTGTMGRLLIVTFFLTSLALGALAHLNLKVSRRVAAQLVMGVISDSLRGTIKVGSFTRLSKNGIAVDNVVVLDPEGRTIIKVQDLSAEVELFPLVERIFSDNEKLSIEIKRVEANDCEVYLLPTTSKDEKGQLESYPSIADAFLPIEEPKKAKKKEGRPVRIWFPHIRLRRLYAKGSVAGSPTMSLRVAGARARVLATDKGASVDVNRFRMKLSGIGGVDTGAHGEVHVRAPGAVWGDVAGSFGEIPFSQKFRFEDGGIHVEGQLPALEPKAMRPVLGTWPLDRTVAVTNRIEGKPPTLTASATIQPEDAAGKPTTALGILRLSPQVSVDLKVVTNKLNLQEHISTLPPSSLDSEIQVRIRQEADNIAAVFEGKIAEGSVAGEKTPSAQILGKLDAGGLSADAKIAEEGLRAQIHVSHAEESGTNVSAHIDELDLSKNQRAHLLTGHARGTLRGDLDVHLSENEFDASAELSGGGLLVSEAAVSSAHLTAKAKGPLDAPLDAEATARLEVTGATLGPVKLKSGALDAQGKLLHPELQLEALTERDLTLAAKGRARVDRSELLEVSASITGRGKPVEAEVKRLSFANSRIKAENFLLRSIGEIRGDVDWGDGGGRVDVEASGLNVSRIATNLGLPKNEFGGNLDANVHLQIGTHSEGTVDLEITQGALSGINNVNLDAHATIEGHTTRGNINGSIAHLGEVESSWEGQLAGPLLEAHSYSGASGRGHIHLRDLDLKGLSLLLGKAIGLSNVSGSVSANLDVEKDASSDFFGAELSFNTKNLVVPVGEGEEQVVLRGLDLEGGLSLSPEDKRVEAVVRADDREGTFASLSVAIDAPLRSLTSPQSEEVSFWEKLQTTPINAALVMPRRNIEEWPNFIPLPVEEGTVSLRASATGTLKAPELSVTLDATRIDGKESPFSYPIDIALNGSYLPASGRLRGGVTLTSKRTQIGTAQLDLVIPVEHFSAPPRGQVALWTGSAQVQLDSAPLGFFKALKAVDVRGTAQGLISIERTGWAPRISSEARLRGLEFGGRRLGDALLEVQTHESDLVARTQFTDDYGTLEATAEAGITPTRTFIRAREDRPIQLTLQSERYDAAIVMPFVSGVLDELSGSLTGKLKAEWTPPPVKEGEWRAVLSGSMKMTDGVIAPSALGLRLEDTRMTLTAGPEGEMNVVRIRNISARADSERHNLRGDAILYLDSLSLQGGTFHLSPEDVPLKSEGSELARLTGTAQGRFDMTTDVTRVQMTINNMEATLPEASDADLFGLEENPTIEIVQRSRRVEEKVKEETSVTELEFELGNNVRIKSDFLDLKMRGSPQMRIGEDLQMRGALELIPGGRILVMGRRFSIERGTVLFDTGDATDPHLSATASWQAPNAVLVRVTVTGTAQAPKLSWSSEPALAGGEAEIIALVIGGGGGTGGEEAATAGAASALAYGANEAAGQAGLDRLQFYTTQESSADGRMASLNDTGSETYTFTWRISDELWFEGSYEKPNGTGPQVDAQEGISGTLDWRFHPHWSVRSEVGTLGAGLDLVWRYRY